MTNVSAASPAPAPSPAPQQRPRHACPVAAVEDALLLLTTGRTSMARRVLEALPALLTRAERERLQAENEELRGRVERAEAALARTRDLQARLVSTARELADLKATLAVAGKASAKPLAKPHERLAAALADGRVTAQRVAELLKGDPRHAYEVASGRVGLAPSAWKRVMNEVSIHLPGAGRRWPRGADAAAGSRTRSPRRS